MSIEPQLTIQLIETMVKLVKWIWGTCLDYSSSARTVQMGDQRRFCLPGLGPAVVASCSMEISLEYFEGSDF